MASIWKAGFIAAASIAALFGTASSSSASSLINVSIQAQDPSVAGSTFSNNIQVQPNKTYNFRLLVSVAPLGTTNATFGQITQLVDGVDGANSIPKFDVFETAADPTPVSITAATISTAPDNWSQGNGATAGAPTATRSTLQDLIGTRLALTGGTFRGVTPSVALTGTFTTGSTVTGTSSLQGRLNSNSSGSFKINNGANGGLFSATTTDADPVVGYLPLSITAVPEPASLGLAGLGAIGLLTRRRRLA